MARAQHLEIESLTEASFAPFGELLLPESRASTFEGVNIHGWACPFETDAPTLIMVLTCPYSGAQIRILERHLDVTQAYVPTGGSPAVVAFAAPTDPDDPAAVPPPDQVRAFLVDGSVGFVMKRGTWHSNRYPLYPTSSSGLVITDSATQAELQDVPRPQWRRTQDIDYEAHFGVVLVPVLGGHVP